LQNLVDKNHHRLSPKDLSHDFTGYPSVSLLSSDGEKLESLKRSLQDMQSELKDLYAALSLPHRVCNIIVVLLIALHDRSISD